MALTVLHEFSSPKGAAPDPTQVDGPRWNAPHVLTGALDPSALPPGAAGTVLVGGTPPVYSPNPTVTTLTASHVLLSGILRVGAAATGVTASSGDGVFARNATQGAVLLSGAGATLAYDAGTFSLTGPLTPTLDNAYDLGTSIARWQTACLSKTLRVGTNAANPLTVAPGGLGLAYGMGLYIRNQSNSGDVRAVSVGAVTPNTITFGDPGYSVEFYGSPISFVSIYVTTQIVFAATAKLCVDDGTPAAPGLTFGNEPTMGVCRIGASHLGFAANTVTVAAAGTTAASLRFGGTGSPPMLKRDGRFIQLRLNDDSAVSGDTTGNLPAAGASHDGLIGFDTTTHKFVYYEGGARYALTGTAF